MGKKQVYIILAILLFLNVTQLNLTRTVGTFNRISYAIRIFAYLYVVFHIIKANYALTLRRSYYYRYCVFVSGYMILNMIFTYLWTNNINALSITFPTLFYLADNAMFLYLGYQIANQKEGKDKIVNTLWWFAVISALSMAAISINFRMKYGSLSETWQLIYGDEEHSGLGQMFQFYKNSFPYKFAILIPFFFLKKSKFNIPLVIICVVSILIVGKKGPLLAGSIAAVFTFIFSNHYKGRFILYGSYAVFIFLFYFTFVDDSILTTLEYRLNPAMHYNAEDTASFYLSGRDNIWNTIIAGFNRSDFMAQMFGHGNTGILNWLPRLGLPGNAHNTWLEILYNYGILGVLVYLSFYIYLFKMYFRMRRDKYEYADYVGFLLIFVISSSVISVSIYGGFQSMGYFGLLTAFLIGMYIKKHQHFDHRQFRSEQIDLQKRLYHKS